MSSKEIITILKRLNMPVNNHMSVMEPSAVEAVENFFRDVKANAAAKRAGGQPQNGGDKPRVGAGQVSSDSGKRPDRAVPQTNGEQQTQQPNRTGGQSMQVTNQDARESGRAQENTSKSAETPRTGSGTGDSRSANARGGDRRGGQGGGREGGNRGGQGQGGQGGYRGGQGQGSQGGYRGGQGQGGQGQGGNRGGQGGFGSRDAANRGGQGQGGQGGYRGGQGQGGQGQGGNRGGQGGFGNRDAANRGGQGQGGQGGYRGGQGQGGFGGGQGGNRGGQGGYRGGRPGGNRLEAQLKKVLESTPTAKPDPRSGNAGGKPAKPFGKFESGRDEVRGKRKGSDRHFEDNDRFTKGPRKKSGEKREKVDNTPKKIIVKGSMTVGELAKALHKELAEVIKKLISLGIMATINHELDLDTIQLVADEFGVEVDVRIPVEEDNFETIEEVDDPELLRERPPVVTIMGHVDHGKTTLLDAIRSTNVTAGEAGGITQHIGAYQVEVNGKKITFLDTPGHEAFTSMRARGASVTDITVLVVAADDGVMPQTVEAINHAKAANVPIIVAVNKIDKPEADPDRIKQDLTHYGLVPEEWGGDTIFVNLSAKHKQNLDQLLEMILLVAEVQEFKANPDKRARGTVIEAELDKGKGPVARVLVQNGTLKVGDAFVAGVCFGRVRAMVNDKGRRLKEAGPSTPVEITGLTEVPLAGDPFMVFEDERKARTIAEKRATTLRQSEMGGANKRVTLDELYKQIKEGEIKDLNVIIKADVQGTAEALRSSLEKIEVEGVRVKILHVGVGAITESDVTLATASNAIVIGFNVRPEPGAQATAEQEKVDIRLHNIIYKVIEEIEAAMKGMLDPVFKETVIGHAEVRNIFKISKVGTIAGCMVTDGKIQRNAQARLVRDGTVVYDGKVESLKRFKDDVREVVQGYECGITLENYQDVKEGDVIEAYVLEKVER
ncbi:translation initiation factor IF-2 [Paenibacillus thermoaerophilus]|uniref:translation initiation factor IF-2 n=1 Tax=Paenibacillus thermoaerophilus TaxID=1215385 RepID=UPI00110DC9E6|nr:translation initiation factor IF-2 [Paenibacillus thermoaerophilus]